VGAGDHVAQARRVLVNLESQLAAAGAGPADLLKATVGVVTSECAPLTAVWEVVRASAFDGAASMLLGVGALGDPDQLVEIEAIASLD
jgi:enamine deaminase RidA (YjgF/YER057c/UK114 family)